MKAKKLITFIEEDSSKPKDGIELDAMLQAKKIPNDVSWHPGMFKGKEFEPAEVTPDGNLIHVKTKKSIGQCYVTPISVTNGAPYVWEGKSIKFLGRKIWAFAGRGYAYEVEIDGQYGLLSNFTTKRGTN